MRPEQEWGAGPRRSGSTAASRSRPFPPPSPATNKIYEPGHPPHFVERVRGL